MDKYESLKKLLKSYGKLAIAYSGGVDSTFLLKAAIDTLGRENVLAITVKSQVIPEQELKEAEELAKQMKARHLMLRMDVLSLPEFKTNPVDRCYFCKKHIFLEIFKAAEERGFHIVADGTNRDDEGDYRPGMKALQELKVTSPLKQCSLTKADIRNLSKELRLSTHDKPSLACLASRIPYGQEITGKKLQMTGNAEQYLRSLGFSQLRVRCHGDDARIELLPKDLIKVFQDGLNIKIYEHFKALGFRYTALDLMGYRTGSLNEDVKKNG